MAWVCPQCKEPGKDRKIWKNRPAPYCTDCRNLRQTMNRYKLSADEVLHARTRLCEICLESTAAVIDHCHASGKTRGALCYPCNNLLGAAADKTKILLNAVAYLLEKTQSD